MGGSFSRTQLAPCTHLYPPPSSRRVPRQTVDLLTGVRRELDRVLKRKIEQPDSDVNESGRHILEAVIHLISSH